jgi:hypothetical protein
VRSNDDDDDDDDDNDAGESSSARVILVATHHSPVIKGASAPEHESNLWTCAFSTNLLDSEDGKREGLAGGEHVGIRAHALVYEKEAAWQRYPADYEPARIRDPHDKWAGSFPNTDEDTDEEGRDGTGVWP